MNTQLGARGKAALTEANERHEMILRNPIVAPGLPLGLSSREAPDGDVFELFEPRKRGELLGPPTVSFVEGEKAARGSDRIETHQGSSLALEHRMAAV